MNGILKVTTNGATNWPDQSQMPTAETISNHNDKETLGGSNNGSFGPMRCQYPSCASKDRVFTDQTKFKFAPPHLPLSRAGPSTQKIYCKD